MNTPRFSGKLDGLPATLDLLADFDAGTLAAALSDRKSLRHAIAVGSGGSAVAAEYLARCRDTLGLGSTSVQTPMRMVMDLHELDDGEVWLFSAGANNADILAAAQAAMDRHCGRLHLVTRNAAGAATVMVAEGGGTVHVVPVADAKDGYLATHSLLGFVGSLLIASDMASREPKGVTTLLETLASHLATMRTPEVRSARVDMLHGMRGDHTIMVASDPRLQPLAVLLETSLWEASLCAVQATDLRNLGHGRHAWLYHRPDRTTVLAFCGIESHPAWNSIDAALSSDVRRNAFAYGGCGRLENVVALIDGLGFVEAMGEVTGIDPGKPGIGEFGRALYEDRSLEGIAHRMPVRVRHKRAAIARVDVVGDACSQLPTMARDRLAVLAGTDIAGLVFDYDGTMVTTEGRLAPPNGDIVAELFRLHDAGLRIGIATGRGGSAGGDLRKVLPVEVQRSVLVGYYNGGHLKTVDVDIGTDRPAVNAAILRTAEWLRRHPGLFLDPVFDEREIQITIEMAKLTHPYRFTFDMQDCPTVGDGAVRIIGSGHSFDIVPLASTKLAVVDRIRRDIGPDGEILRFGDSGSTNGNDNALLSDPFGISVGEVCGAANGCWSLFGSRPTGPEALLKVLRALIPNSAGRIRLSIGSLGIDSRRDEST